MSRCPPHCCSKCRDELRQERITQKAKARRIDICSIGPVPGVNHNSEDDSGTDATDLENEPISIEEGDQILATRLLPPPSMDICMLSTISQQLAEAATPVLEYLKESTSVFSKQTFDILPEPKEWDHAIELIPGSKPSGCKIYPLLPTEQKELDAFLKENLETGHI